MYSDNRRASPAALSDASSATDIALSLSTYSCRSLSNSPFVSNPTFRNKNETVAQNYRRLGLAAKLNRAAGGVAKDPTTLEPVSSSHFIIKPSQRHTQAAAISEAKVERDPTTGAILVVHEDEQAKLKKSRYLNDPLADLDSDSDDEDGARVRVSEHNMVTPSSRSLTGASGASSVVAQLEAAAMMEKPKKIRTQSEREVEWIEALVAKHGFDYGKMFRDTKLNPMQQSEGDLKRRIAKWRKSKGDVVSATSA